MMQRDAHRSVPDPFPRSLLLHRFQVGKPGPAGGQARTYEAHDIRSGRQVVIKVSRAQDGSRERTGFAREIHIHSSFSNPRIPEFLGSGEHGGMAFMAIGHVGTMGLHRQVVPPLLSPHTTVRIALQLCEPLAYLEDRRLVHRDVAPNNVRLDLAAGRPEVWLIDFGCATLLQSPLEYPLRGQPNYMAPELLRAPPQFDFRSDIHSAAVVLYELLTGQLPYPSNLSERNFLICKAFGEPLPLRSVPTGRHLPVSLEEVLARALARLPSERFQHAAGFRAALERVLPELEVF